MDDIMKEVIKILFDSSEYSKISGTQPIGYSSVDATDDSVVVVCNFEVESLFKTSQQY